MVALPLTGGISATPQADFTTVFPVNMEAVPQSSGISAGYLRTAPGAATQIMGPGVDRGGIVDASGIHYRVMGTKLVSVAGTITTLGDVGGTGPVSMDYGFGRLAIRSGTALWYWNGSTLTQVTDPDLGPCLDIVWMDGYYVSTDGTDIVVSDLANPTSYQAIKYGSAESDPDAITGLGRLRDELIVFGANTVQFFSDAGTAGFPFQANPGATIPIGCVGPLAKVRYNQTYAFVGGGRNQANGVYLVGGGEAKKISTRAIDDMLAAVTNSASIQLEARVARDEQRLLVHLPDRTLVCLNTASTATQEAVWYIARSGPLMNAAYRPRNAVYFNGRWWVGDTQSAALGVLDDSVTEHFGETTGWQLQTACLFNGANGAIVHSLELVGLPGRDKVATTVYASFSTDLETWTQEKEARRMMPGAKRQRTTFTPHKRFRNYMAIKFRGSGVAGWASCEAQIEGLAS